MSNAQPPSVGAYLYCVTYSQPFLGNGSRFHLQGIAGRPARFVTEGDLAAAVSDSPQDEYDLTLEHITAHERVIEAVMQNADVLPISFGTVAPSDRDVREQLLTREGDELRQQLQAVKNRVELGVKALWDQNALFAQIVAEDPAIQQLRDQIVDTSVEETYDLRIQLGELVDAAIQRRREVDAAAILTVLSPLAADTRTNDVFTDMMIINAAFLVERERVQAFRDTVNERQQAYTRWMTLQFAGPLPPYNFVSLVVRWEEPSGAIAP